MKETSSVACVETPRVQRYFLYITVSADNGVRYRYRDLKRTNCTEKNERRGHFPLLARIASNLSF